MRHCTSTSLSDGNYTDLQVTRVNAAGRSSTIDYHNSLLDQARQQHESEQPERPHTHQCHPTHNHSLGSIRQWLPLSNIKRQRTSGNNDNSGRGCNKKAKNEKDHNNRELAPPPHPHLTRKDIEEFEALPVAIRRKVSFDHILFSFFIYSSFLGYLCIFFCSYVHPCLLLPYFYHHLFILRHQENKRKKRKRKKKHPIRIIYPLSLHGLNSPSHRLARLRRVVLCGAIIFHMEIFIIPTSSSVRSFLSYSIPDWIVRKGT